MYISYLFLKINDNKINTCNLAPFTRKTSTFIYETTTTYEQRKTLRMSKNFYNLELFAPTSISSIPVNLAHLLSIKDAKTQKTGSVSQDNSSVYV